MAGLNDLNKVALNKGHALKKGDDNSDRSENRRARRKNVSRRVEPSGARQDQDDNLSLVVGPIRRGPTTKFGEHHHPRLAEGRARAENCVYSLLQNRVVTIFDVGGSAGGFKRAAQRALGRATYHNLAPVTCAPDVVRAATLDEFVKSFNKPRMTYCRDTLRDCTHLNVAGHRVFIFTHSFYYMDDADMMQLRVGDEVFIITHLFDGDSGYLPPRCADSTSEFRWVRSGGLIHMCPEGPCGTIYAHPDPTEYLRRACRETIKVGHGYLSLTEKFANEGTHIFYGVVGAQEFAWVHSGSPALTAPAMTEAIEGAIRSGCARLSATSTQGDIVDTVGRVTSMVVNRFTIPVDIARRATERIAEETVTVSREYLHKMSSNEAIFERTVASGLRNQTSVLPLFGPFAPRCQRTWFAVFVGWVYAHQAAFWDLMRRAKLAIFYQPLRKLISTPSKLGKLDETGLLDPETVHEVPLGHTELVSNVTNCLCLGYGNIANVDPKHRIEITPVPCGRKAQSGAELMFLSVGPAYVLSSCLCNFHNALTNRHAVRQPRMNLHFEASAALLRANRDEAAMIYAGLLAEAREGEGWLRKWTRSKQDAILSSCFGTHRVLPHLVSSFIKREVNHSKPSKARLIQGYSNLATQAAFGPEFQSLQKTWSSIFDGSRFFQGITLTIASGMNAAQLGDWLHVTLCSFPNAVFYERDGKNWDATMQDAHFELKASAFDIAGPEFLKFLRQSKDVVGRPKNNPETAKYSLHGTVKSGHNDTSSGNSLINLMISYEVLVRHHCVGAIIVNGDDCLMAVQDGDISLERFLATERGFGIVPEARIFQRWQDVTFLSAIWAETGDPNHPFAFIPKPGRLLSRVFWTTQKLSKKQRETWAREVADCVLRAVSGVPVISTFVGLASPLSCESSRPVGRDYTAYAVQNPIYDCADWFKQRYGVSDEQIRECENFLLSLPRTPGLIGHPVLDTIVKVDLADIEDREPSSIEL